MKSALAALSALAHETRLAIFRMLVAAGPQGLAAGQIAESLDIPAATLSFHLKELAQAEMVAPKQQGRFIYYRANFEQMAALMSYLTENCCQGMPAQCVDVMQSSLVRSCSAVPTRSPSERRSSRETLPRARRR